MAFRCCQESRWWWRWVALVQSWTQAVRHPGHQPSRKEDHVESQSVLLLDPVCAPNTDVRLDTQKFKHLPSIFACKDAWPYTHMLTYIFGIAVSLSPSVSTFKVLFPDSSPHRCLTAVILQPSAMVFKPMVKWKCGAMPCLESFHFDFFENGSFTGSKLMLERRVTWNIPYLQLCPFLCLYSNQHDKKKKKN